MITLNDQEVEFESYPNGESRLVEDSVRVDRDSNLVYFQYAADNDLIQLMILKRFLDNLKIPSVLMLTHMPYARMDRAPITKAFSLKYVADLINFLDFQTVGVIDPHSDVSTALLNHSVELTVMDKLVSEAIIEIHADNGNPIYSVFPDAGALKKYERFAGFVRPDDREYYFGVKHRNFDNGDIESLGILSPHGFKVAPGANALIIDDLCSRGGTFVLASQALRGLGFHRVFLAVAHCEDSARNPNLWGEINHVFTTDSMNDQWDRCASESPDFITRYSQLDLIGDPTA